MQRLTIPLLACAVLIGAAALADDKKGDAPAGASDRARS